MEQNKPINTDQEISIGLTLRHITSYMFAEYTRTMKELSTQTSPENKRYVLLTLVKDYHQCIKKLLKFIKNCKKFKKFLKIDRLTAMMLLYKDNIKLVIDDLYFVNEMCMLYRTPSFDIAQGIKTINHIAHDQLKKDIGNVIVIQQNFNYETKEKQFEFIQKYLYNESLSNELNSTKMITQCEQVLDIPIQLIPIQDTMMAQYVRFKDNLFWFSFDKFVLFKLMPTVYRVNDNNGIEISLMTYYCQKVNFSKMHMPLPKEMIEKLKKKYLNKVNSLLYNEIKFNVTELLAENARLALGIDLQLRIAQGLLNQFIIDAIYPDLFQYIKSKTHSYISKHQMPLVIKDINKEELMIEYNCPHMNINFNLRLIARLNIGKILLKTSKYIAYESPFIIGDDNEELFSLFSFPYQTILSNCITSFELISINLLSQKLNKISSMFIPFSFIINGNRKIDFILSNTYLIFSIVINAKGNIELIDSEFNFNEVKAQEIRDLFISFFKTDMIDVSRFNEIIFEEFITNYFNFSKIKLVYESRMIMLNEIAYNFSLPKYCTNDINFVLEIITQYAERDFIIKGTKLKFWNKANGIEVLSINFRQWLNLKTTKYEYSLQSFDYLLKIITIAFDKYDEFFKNTRELLILYKGRSDKVPIFKTKEEGSIITVLEKEYLNQLFNSLCYDTELSKVFNILINGLEILNCNVIFKFFLNQYSLNDYLKYKLQSYTLMDNDCIISFSIKDYCLTFYYLSKLKHLEINPTKKIFTVLMPNFLRFFIKLQSFIRANSNLSINMNMNINSVNVNNNNNQSFFDNEHNYILSPLCLQFKINSFNKERQITVQFQTDSKITNVWKVMIIPNDICLNEFYVDHINIFNDEINLVPNLKNYFAIDQVYQMLIMRFLSYATPFTRAGLTMLSIHKNIFVLIKDFNTFEIFCKEKFSLLIEVKKYDLIEVYSTFSNNPTESMNLMEKIASYFKSKPYVNGRLVFQFSNYAEVYNDMSAVINIIDKYQPLP